MNERSYDECIEIVITALCWRPQPMFDASLFDGAYAGLDFPQLDRAEAIAIWRKGLLFGQIGAMLIVNGRGVDPPSVLFDLLHADRIAIIGAKITSPVRCVRQCGFRFEILTDRIIRDDEVSLLLLPLCGSRAPTEPLQAEPAPAELIPAAPKKRRKRFTRERGKVLDVMREFGLKRCEDTHRADLAKEICDKLGWNEGKLRADSKTLQRAFDDLREEVSALS
jgi:hypothetical protein